MSKSRNWICTLNNPTMDFNTLWNPETMVYMCGQLEQGEQGTRHFQFFVNFNAPRAMSFCLKVCSAHWEIAKDVNKARNYCKKEDTRIEGPWEFGTYKAAGGDKKSISYLETSVAWDADKTALSPYAICMYDKARKILKKEEKHERPPFPYEYHPWQLQLIARLGVRDDRKIIFIVDFKGGCGKTKFSSWYTDREDSIYITIEKKENLLFIVDSHHTTIFMDVARSELEYLNYASLEKIKDGHWISGKYEGKAVHRYDPAHVVVFCNSYPSLDALSKDRYEVYLVKNFKLDYLSVDDIQNL